MQACKRTNVRKRTANSQLRSVCTDVPELKRTSRVRKPSAKVLSQLDSEDESVTLNGFKGSEGPSSTLPPKKSFPHTFSAAQALPPLSTAKLSLFDDAVGPTADEINFASTGSISQFLIGIDQLGDADKGSTTAMRRIASYATLADTNGDAGSVDGSGSDTDGGSFSNDSSVVLGSSATLASPLPKHAMSGGFGSSLEAGDGGSSSGRHSPNTLANASKDAATNRKEWAAWEDEAIRSGVMTIGTKWRQIAAELPGRSDDAVRNRWARLQQSLCGTKLAAPPRVKRAEGAEQRQSWTDEEDEIISSSVREFGHRWNRIAERLPRRTEHAIRNRWHRIQMREFEERSGSAAPASHGLAALATDNLSAAQMAAATQMGAAAAAPAAILVPEEASAVLPPHPELPPPAVLPSPTALPLPGRVTAPMAASVARGATLERGATPACDGVVVVPRCDSLDVDGVTTAFYMDMQTNFDVDDVLVGQ